jgi:hypothetical protein
MPREKHHRELAATCRAQSKEAKSDGDRQQLLLLAAEHLKLAQAEAQTKLDGKQPG